MSEMKPCPFCGGEAEFDSIKEYYFVRCKTCGASTHAKEKIKDAMWLWNLRKRKGWIYRG